MKRLIFPLLFLIIISSCKRIEPVKKDSPQETKPNTENIQLTDQMIMSTLWYQLSAERQALCYQAFNLAKKNIDEKLKNPESKLPPAVVVDVDETMLDNSPYEGKCIKTKSSYTSESWKEWTDKASAKPVTGAVEFCNYAKQKGVEVFYISNRKVEELESTMNNMRELGFPYIRETNFMFKDESSGKEERRKKVRENYNILLLIGDNLIDFDEIFEPRMDNYGINVVIENRNNFGDKFIILPNPIYGDWEKALYKGIKGYTDLQKDSVRRSLVISQ